MPHTAGTYNQLQIYLGMRHLLNICTVSQWVYLLPSQIYYLPMLQDWHHLWKYTQQKRFLGPSVNLGLDFFDGI